MMKKMILTAMTASMIAACNTEKKPADDGLVFDASVKTQAELTMPDGAVIKYDAYEKLYYVKNVEDSTYQYMNIYVPEGATEQSPIFLREYVGGYMAAEARQPQAEDATGRALQEGYVVVIPGVRGRNSVQGDVYTGRAPKGLLDLKAAIRYLRRFDKEIPGNTERIITDGTSAGGAMSALLGATGNSKEYGELLKAMGAADERDDIFCAVCFCPITDLEHADMAYEWLYGETDSRRADAKSKRALTKELAAKFHAYQASLGLKKADGTLLTADNYLDYIKTLIIQSAQEAKDAGADIPDSIGFTFSNEAGGQAPINGGVGMPVGGGHTMGMAASRKSVGEYVTDVDMKKYLNYIVSTQPLKSVPAFDSYNVDGAAASGENGEFGDAQGSNVNFTEWAAAKAGTAITDDIRQNAYLLNPMNFIGTDKAKVAPHWYIRHGARDRDTAFPIPVNLALKLQNSGKDVNFKLPWNRPHSGDYALDELFQWIRDIME
jgi:acetyl esterase/lipase